MSDAAAVEPVAADGGDVVPEGGDTPLGPPAVPAVQKKSEAAPPAPAPDKETVDHKVGATMKDYFDAGEAGCKECCECFQELGAASAPLALTALLNATIDQPVKQKKFATLVLALLGALSESKFFSRPALETVVLKCAETVGVVDMDCPGYCAFFANVVGVCVAKKMLGPNVLTAACERKALFLSLTHSTATSVLPPLVADTDGAAPL